LDSQIGPEELADFDHRIQEMVQTDYKEFVQICTGPSQVVKNLSPAMLREAEHFLEPYLQGASVSDLFLKQKAGPEVNPSEDLLQSYDEAAPEIGKTNPGKEICVVVVPNDDAGKILEDAMTEAVAGVKIAQSDRSDEIVFYREQLQLSPSDLALFGPVPQEAYRSRETLDPGTLHCREDVTEWQSAMAPTPHGSPVRQR
jgi:hypothetical protein